jgi:predicted DNA-binding WGR domain protein
MTTVRIRIRKTSHKYYWVEEQKADGTWLIIDSFDNRQAAQRNAALELVGDRAWARYQGHKNRVSWIFRDDWRLSIWHHQIMRDKPFVVLEHQKEISRWPTLNQARIALLMHRSELA